jgi:acetyl-CoA C-acetyltransferase
MDKAKVPVLVGTAQLVHRAKTQTQLDPLDMMADSSRAAAEDATLGGLAGVDTLYVVNCLSRELGAPEQDLSTLLDIRPARTGYSLVGATAPQWFVNRAAEDIYSGRSEVVLICGAEAFYTEAELPPLGRGMELLFSEDEQTLAQRFAGDVRRPLTALEMQYGLVLPVTMYAFFENALRAHWGMSIPDHSKELSAFCAGFSQIASRNPFSWFREAKTAEQIATVTEDNRMVVFPYTKWMCSNMTVNQSAALIMTSLAKAEGLGIPQDKMVFLRGSGDAEDRFLVCERPHLWASPSVAEAVDAALGKIPLSLDEVEYLDFYSCFPSAPRVAREMLEILPDDPRPLTITGGMPYFGGSGNNYALHAICRMIDILRKNPESYGLVQALSWFISKHSVGVYKADPGARPWTPQNLKAKDGSYPGVRVVPEPQGSVRIESYALTYGREGRPRSATVFCRDANDNRCIASVAPDPDVLEQMTREEPIGRPGTVAHDPAESKNWFHFE